MKINFSNLLDTQINDLLLNAKFGGKADKISKPLIKFANKYGFFGSKAIDFIMDLTNTLTEVMTAMKEEEKKNED